MWKGLIGVILDVKQKSALGSAVKLWVRHDERWRLRCFDAMERLPTP